MQYQGLLDMPVSSAQLSSAQPVIVGTLVCGNNVLCIIRARLTGIMNFNVSNALCSAGIVGCHSDIDVGG